MLKKFIILLISILFLTSCQSKIEQDSKPIAKNGVLDISNWDFTNSGNLQLKGEWEFYWQKLYNPQEFTQQNIKPTYFFDVPGYWNDKNIDTTQLTGQSYATYRLKIKSDTTAVFDIFIGEQMTAYNFWCNNKLVFKCGNVSANKEEATPQRHPTIKEIKILKGDNEIVFQISNHHHKHGGFYTVPQIGTFKNIHLQRARSISIDIFLFGSLLIIGLYHIIISINRRGLYATLLFGIFSLILALRTLLTGSKFISSVFPNFSWAAQVRLEYFSAYFSASFIVAYLYMLYKEDFNKKIVLTFITVNILLCFTLLLPASLYTNILPVFHINILLSLLYYLYRMVIIVKRKRNGSIITIVSILLFAVTVIADILLVRGNYLDSTDLVPIGVFILMFGQSLVFAKFFNQHFVDNERLRVSLNKQNKELEIIVKKQSKELKQQQQSILEQNKEIEKQNDEIKYKNDELVKQTKLLEESESKLKSTIQLLPESIFEIDWKGNIILANNEFYESTGYIKEDKLNIENLFIYQKNCNLFFNCMTEHMQDSNIVKELRIDIKRKDDSIFPALLSASRLDENETVAFRCTFTEITHRILDQETIRNAYEEIKEKNQKISDSLRYASTIQKAVMPSHKAMQDNFKGSFVINKPHSIVSGDFYYLKKKNDKIIFALSDCTGHGVPGGFMTMLGITLLNQIYSEDKLVSPEIALDMMRYGVIKSLHQSTDSNMIGNQDGMDMILCILDTKTLLLKFASAKQSLLLARGCKIQKFNGDKMPVGIYSSMKDYTLHEVQLQKDDILYYYTDGVIDIFGGEKEKRLLSKGLKQIIYSCCDKNIESQREIIQNKLKEWQGDKEQIDDMLMIGLQV